MEELIAAINKQFGTDKPTSAVFFHHDAEGNLKTISPMINFGKPEDMTVNKLIKTLYQYSDACKSMADGMVKKGLNKN